MSVRGEAMAARRRLDSQLKRERVIAAADARPAAGHNLSIAGIARHAGVSRKFIYAHPDPRAVIEQRAQQSLTTGQARATTAGRVTIASLRADAANLKAQNRRLREQVTALEQRLSTAIGTEIAKELDPAPEQSPEQLRIELEDYRGRVFELEEALADAHEELEAVREINRELIATSNRST
jgi:hypothetical protein